MIKVGPAAPRTCSCSSPGPRPAAPTSCRWRSGSSSQAQGLAGVVGRAAREPARGPVGAQHGQAPAGDGTQLFNYYLGFLTNPSIKHHFQFIPNRERRVRQAVGDAGRGGGPAPRDRGGAQARRQGRARRPLARRFGRDRVRDLELPRQAGRRPARRPGLHRRRQPRPAITAAAGDRRRWQSSTPQRPRRGSRSAASPAPFAGLFNATGSLGALLEPNAALARASSSRCCPPI